MSKDNKETKKEKTNPTDADRRGMDEVTKTQEVPARVQEGDVVTSDTKATDAQGHATDVESARANVGAPSKLEGASPTPLATPRTSSAAPGGDPVKGPRTQEVGEKVDPARQIARQQARPSGAAPKQGVVTADDLSKKRNVALKLPGKTALLEVRGVVAGVRFDDDCIARDVTPEQINNLRAHFGSDKVEVEVIEPPETDEEREARLAAERGF